MDHIVDIKVGDIFSHLSYRELHELEYLLAKRGMYLYIMDIKNSSIPRAIVMGDSGAR